MASARDFIKSISKGTPSFELNCVGIAATKKAIRSMGSTKAIGVDGLPCAFWKQYCEDLAPFVTLVINTSIKSGTYPTLFKDAIVVPVFKGGRKDREDPASYRPISVLPAISKVLEKVVIDQFLDYLDENNLLPPAQHGFRQGHSTVTALVRTIQKWTSQKGSAIAPFDYSAAFDTISKETVQQRLEDIGASNNFKAWMASYMAGGRQKVRWNGALSSFLSRLHGVAQGSKAGPLIFIFVTMVNFALLKSAIGYADDTSNSSNLVSGLNVDSEVLVGLSKELGLVLNPSKTQCIIYGKVSDSADPISVDGVTIAPKEKITLLGFTLDSKLQPQLYLKELADSVLYRKHVVGRLSAHLPPHVLKMFARATVLGKIRTYLHLSLKVRLSEKDPQTIWGKKLQVIVNDVARVVVRKRRSDHVRVEDLLKKSGLQAVNAMVCSNSAMLAWRASKTDSPLHDLFLSMLPNGCTRNRSAGKIEVPPPNTKNLAVWNMAMTWNAIPDLSVAKSEGKAKEIVRKFVKSLPI